MTFIDPTAERTVSIIRRNAGSRDSTTGQFVSSVTTVQSGIVADLQATLQNDMTVRNDKGVDIKVDYVLYPQTYLSTPFRVFDLVVDSSDSKEYDILNIRDFRNHWELYLRSREKAQA